MVRGPTNNFVTPDGADIGDVLYLDLDSHNKVVGYAPAAPPPPPPPPPPPSDEAAVPLYNISKIKGVLIRVADDTDAVDNNNNNAGQYYISWNQLNNENAISEIKKTIATWKSKKQLTNRVNLFGENIGLDKYYVQPGGNQPLVPITSAAVPPPLNVLPEDILYKLIYLKILFKRKITYQSFYDYGMDGFNIDQIPGQVQIPVHNQIEYADQLDKTAFRLFRSMFVGMIFILFQYRIKYLEKIRDYILVKTNLKLSNIINKNNSDGDISRINQIRALITKIEKKLYRNRNKMSESRLKRLTKLKEVLEEEKKRNK